MSETRTHLALAAVAAALAASGAQSLFALNARAGDTVPGAAPLAPAYRTQLIWPDTVRDPRALAPRLAAARQEPGFKYFTQKNGSISVELVTQRRWLEKFSPGGRLDYLIKFYYANTRDASLAGLRHAACFDGTPDKLASLFFSDSDPRSRIRDLTGELLLSTSSDGFMMGVQFTVLVQGKPSTHHFRIPSCSATGKGPLFSPLDGRPVEVSENEGEANRELASGDPGAERGLASLNPSLNRSLAAVEKPGDGFTIEDEPADAGASGLPRFQLRGDYDRAFMGPNDRPWKGMDIRSPKGAMEFALVAQKYMYEGMANQNPDPNHNFEARRNTKRYWCHMPWLNVSAAGREAIHGMTAERPLQKSPVYPDATSGSDWGVAFYNGEGCRTIGAIFGTAQKPRPRPDFSKSAFGDGTFTAKILFTTANFPDLQGAFTWKGHVSPPMSTARSIDSLRHIQMDIAIRDSSITGTNPETNHWVMLTYYYDASYTSPIELPGMHPGFRHMRPVGVQVGFDKPRTNAALEPTSSLIFAGAKTNQLEGRLNGPADNTKSSCLSCHGTAGTTAPMSPGFMSMAEYHRGKAGMLDFSQQILLAKKNWETRPRFTNR